MRYIRHFLCVSCELHRDLRRASPFSTKLAVAEKHEPLRRSARTPSLLRRAPGQSARACRSELLRPALGSRRSGRTSDKWRAPGLLSSSPGSSRSGRQNNHNQYNGRLGLVKIN